MAIRVKSATAYKIPIEQETSPDVWEVTGYLEFDTTDTGLTSKLFKMYEAIDALTAQAEKDAKALEAKDDEDIKIIDEVIVLTKNQIAGAAMIDKFYADAREVLDDFLGKGSCQKIFGDKNYSEMFSDLINQLKPEFKKMGIRAEQIKRSAAQKHKPKRAAAKVMR